MVYYWILAFVVYYLYPAVPCCLCSASWVYCHSADLTSQLNRHLQGLLMDCLISFEVSFRACNHNFDFSNLFFSTLMILICSFFVSSSYLSFQPSVSALLWSNSCMPDEDPSLGYDLRLPFASHDPIFAKAHLCRLSWFCPILRHLFLEELSRPLQKRHC